MASPYIEINGQLADKLVSSLNVGSLTVIATLFLVVIIWSIVWKLLGLWKSARNGSIIWFVVLAITSTLGILPILYIYVFSEMGKKKPAERAPSKKKKRR